MKISIKKISYFCIFSIVIFFLTIYFIKNWKALSNFDWEINLIAIILSFIFILGSKVLSAELWRKTLRYLGIHIGFKKGFAFFNISQLGKYIPGKLWTFLGQVYYLATEGIPKGKSFLGSLIYMSLTMSSGLLFYIITNAFYNQKEFYFRIIPVLVIIPVLLIILHPKVLEVIIKSVYSLLKRKYFDFELNLKYSKIVFVAFCSLLFWTAAGIGFYCLVISIYPLPIRQMPFLAGALSISWMGGVIVLVSPGGLGIREGLMVFFLQSLMPLPIAVAISIVSRVVFFCCDLIAILISFVLKRPRAIKHRIPGRE